MLGSDGLSFKGSSGRFWSPNENDPGKAPRRLPRLNRGLWSTMGMSSLPLRAERILCNHFQLQWKPYSVRDCPKWNSSSYLWAGSVPSGNDYAICIRNAAPFIILLRSLLNICYVVGCSAAGEERDDLCPHALYSLAHKNINQQRSLVCTYKPW